MPKKSRQQKIASQLRRLQEAQNPRSSSNQTVSIKINDFTPKPTVEVKREQTNYRYVFVDLSKTVVFVVAAIIFEVVLSFTLLR